MFIFLTINNCENTKEFQFNITKLTQIPIYKFIDDNKYNIIPINIINLPNAKIRLSKIINNLKAYQQTYHVFNAIHHTEPNFNNLLKLNKIILGKSHRKLGEAGCALSHITIIKNFIKNSSHYYCLILEDDAEIIRRIPQTTFQIDKIFPNDIDILYLTNRVQSDNKKNIISGVGTEGYIINKKGGQKLIEICEYIDCGIDLRFQSHYPYFKKKTQKSKISNLLIHAKKTESVYVIHKDYGISFIEP